MNLIAAMGRSCTKKTIHSIAALTPPQQLSASLGLGFIDADARREFKQAEVTVAIGTSKHREIGDRRNATC